MDIKHRVLTILSSIITFFQCKHFLVYCCESLKCTRHYCIQECEYFESYWGSVYSVQKSKICHAVTGLDRTKVPLLCFLTCLVQVCSKSFSRGRGGVNSWPARARFFYPPPSYASGLVIRQEISRNCIALLSTFQATDKRNHGRGWMYSIPSPTPSWVKDCFFMFNNIISQY